MFEQTTKRRWPPLDNMSSEVESRAARPRPKRPVRDIDTPVGLRYWRTEDERAECIDHPVYDRRHDPSWKGEKSQFSPMDKARKRSSISDLAYSTNAVNWAENDEDGSYRSGPTAGGSGVRNDYRSGPGGDVPGPDTRRSCELEVMDRFRSESIANLDRQLSDCHTGDRPNAGSPKSIWIWPTGSWSDCVNDGLAGYRHYEPNAAGKDVPREMRYTTSNLPLNVWPRHSCFGETNWPFVEEKCLSATGEVSAYASNDGPAKMVLKPQSSRPISYLRWLENMESLVDSFDGPFELLDDPSIWDTDQDVVEREVPDYVVTGDEAQDFVRMEDMTSAVVKTEVPDVAVKREYDSDEEAVGGEGRIGKFGRDDGEDEGEEVDVEQLEEDHRNSNIGIDYLTHTGRHPSDEVKPSSSGFVHNHDIQDDRQTSFLLDYEGCE